MNTYVLDTSVSVAWYLDEVFSKAARDWQDRLLSGTRMTLPLHMPFFLQISFAGRQPFRNILFLTLPGPSPCYCPAGRRS